MVGRALAGPHARRFKISQFLWCQKAEQGSRGRQAVAVAGVLGSTVSSGKGREAVVFLGLQSGLL